MAGRDHVAIWFEERPEQIVVDFTVFKERDETLSGGPVIFYNSTYQKIKSCQTFTIGA